MKVKHYGAIAALAFAAACGSETPAEPDAGSGSTETLASEAADAGNDSATSGQKNAYFGDLHIHTANSFDAYIFGTRSTPDDAYAFAKGEPIRHPGGFDIQLHGPPLDFMAVTDHGEYLGVVPAMDNPDHPIGQTEIAKAVFGENAVDPVAAFGQVGLSFVTGSPIEEIYDVDYINSIWGQTIDAAERHYEPGKFTTFAGYEFTAMTIVSLENIAAANLHRNVIFRDAAPDRLFSTLNSTNPEDLWDWMDGQRAEGRDVLSIPHNSNASNGEMFASETYTGGEITKDYAVQRLRNEPIIEITQLKGTSETHPLLSPNDEWADFELYEFFIGSQMEATVNEGDYARPSLARGMALEDAIGVNPYKFGFIASSDTHVSAGSFEEDTHHGKFGDDGHPVNRQSVPPEGRTGWEDYEPAAGRAVTASHFGASGLAGVWASENTREAIFDAMVRKETFGTSGPRIRVHLKAVSAAGSEVNMGSDYIDASAPTFEINALRDANSAPLQRLQMVKVWHENGEPKEHLTDLACSTGDPVDGRCAENGASVDVSTCEISGPGTGQFTITWSDPEHDPSVETAYYVRVLENPKCRWSTWDAVRNGTPPNPSMDAIIQDRAWSSPIWVKPAQ